jgi:asparagine synthase (glutamine-hydrolysing)
LPIAGLISKTGYDVSDPIRRMLSTMACHGAVTPCVDGGTVLSFPAADGSLTALASGTDRALGYCGLKRSVVTPFQTVLDVAGTFSLVFDGRLSGLPGVEGEVVPALRGPRRGYPVASLFDGVLQGDNDAVARRVSRIVQDFRGSFSLALMDARYGVVARDVLGVEPLYWGETAGYVGFASERKALWTIGIRPVAAYPPGYVTVISKDGVVQHRAVALERPRRVHVGLEAAAERLKQLLPRVFTRYLGAGGDVGVFFSGGVDSSLVAKCLIDLGVTPVLYVAGFEASADLDTAARSAAELECHLRTTVLSLDDAEAILPQVVYAVEEADVMKIGVGLPLYCAAAAARRDGVRTGFSGQGADELFGGYARYGRCLGEGGVEALGDALWHDVVAVAAVNVQRDKGIAWANGLDLVLPFLDLELVCMALSFPPQLKVAGANDGLRKRVLRATARRVGLSEAIVRRPKKALQYGSGAQKAIRRIARRRGFRGAREYVASVFRAVFPEGG